MNFDTFAARHLLKISACVFVCVCVCVCVCVGGMGAFQSGLRRPIVYYHLGSPCFLLDTELVGVPASYYNIVQGFSSRLPDFLFE
jgi:hypothetical protein